MTGAEQVAAAVERNQLAALRELAQGDRAELLVSPEMIRVCSGVAYPLLNFVARPRFDSRTADGRIASLVSYFVERRVPFLVYRHPSAQPADLAYHLERQGLRYAGSQEAMVLQRLDVSPRANRAVQVEVARDRLSRLHAAEVHAAAFHLPPGAAAYLRDCALATAHDPAVYVYLACLQGIAAGALTLVLKERVAGLCGLGTAPAYRGHGVATALLWRAIFDAAALGYRLAGLQAPTGALGLYRRLGFEACFRVEVFAGG